VAWDKECSDRLDAALAAFDTALIDELCAALVGQIYASPGTVPESEVGGVLGALQRKRCFARLASVAEALMQTGGGTTSVRRHYAQALLDQGRVTAAIPFLQALMADLQGKADQREELNEARGLMGRAHKQIYVNTWTTGGDAPRRALESAIGAYRDCYRSDREKYTWQGINAAALLLRAESDGVELQGLDDPRSQGREIASTVLARITGLWENRLVTMWDAGTAMEACVALDRGGEAALWLQRYVSEPKADAFEIGSTLRQMEEVWRLHVDSEPGASLLPVLRAELLQRQGGGFKATPAELSSGAAEHASPEHLEKVLGATRYQSYRFMLRGIERARAVARIENDMGQGYGTGFLLPAASLSPGFGEGLVLLTNAHVCSDDPKVRDALDPEDVRASFELLKEEGRAEGHYRVAELLWTSPPWELDATILRLDNAPADLEAFPVHRRLPLPDGEQRVYVIGHPKGGSLSFSMQDNLLLDHEAPFLHYRAPTEGGSSGSPVFNAQWKLIGLHHAGSRNMRRLKDQKGTYAANEGIWIQSIIGALSSLVE
jgi:hypothetical protein